MMSSKKDFYKLLELSKNANQDEIKKAYHALAKKFHPDKNPNDPNSAEKFKQIKEAYEHLSDSNKKAAYDSIPNTSSPGFTSSDGQTRYKTSTFPQFFNKGNGGMGHTSNAKAGPKIFTFNVSSGAVPVEEMFKMFFGGMNDFGPIPTSRHTPRTPPNPNAVASCQFCKDLFTVTDLIQHQNICPKRKMTDDDMTQMYSDDRPSNKTSDWRQQHQETLNAIKRDRQKASYNNRSWTTPSQTESNEEFVLHKRFRECPFCKKKFNEDIASQHIHICRQKYKEEIPVNPVHREESAYKKSKEYGENLRRKKTDEHTNNNITSRSRTSNFSVESDNIISSDDDDILLKYWDKSPRESLSSRSPRNNILPTLNYYKKLFANRPRKNTSANIYEATVPTFVNKVSSPKESRGCEECVRIYGLRASNIHCSCGVKRSTNVKF